MAVHVGQAEVAAGVAVGEAFVVHTEEMEDGGLEIVDGDDIAGDLFASSSLEPWTMPPLIPAPASQQLNTLA